MPRHAFVQAFMEVVLGTLKVLQAGVQTGWFGLACPAHCGSPVFGTLLAFYLLGVCSTLAVVAFVCLWIFGRPFLDWCFSGSPEVVSGPSQRLAGYLDFQLNAYNRARHRRA